MSEIRHFEIGTGVDLAGLRSGFSQADQLSTQLADRIGARLNSISMPKMDIGKMPEMGGGGANPAASMTDSLLPLAGQLKSAFAPLSNFAADFSRKFDLVGRTIVNSIKKADEKAKFPVFEKTINFLRGAVQSNLDAAEGRFRKFFKVVDFGLGASLAKGKLDQFLGNFKSITGGSLNKLGGFKGVADGFDSAGPVAKLLTVKGATEAVTGSVRHLGAQVALALGAFGLTYKAVGFIKTGIIGASDLNETLSKTDAIFGNSAGVIIAESDKMAASFGTVRGEYITAAGDFGAVFKGLGKPQAEAAALGNSLAKLGMDMASFDTTSNEEAFGAISSALRGEMDPIEKFRVFLTADKVAAEALALGLAKTKGEIGDSAKKMATMSLIMKQTADAQGDLERTAGGSANQMKKFSGTVTNLGTSIGQALLPVLGVAITNLNKLATNATSAFERSKGAVTAFATTVAANVGALVSYLLPSFMAIGSTLAGAFSGGTGAIASWVPTFAQVATGAKTALDAINTGLQATIGFIREIPSMIDATFGAGVAAQIGQIAAGIGATALALTALSGAFGVVSSLVVGLTAPLVAVPVAAAAAGIGIAYLQGSFVSLDDTVDALGFALTNSTDMFDYWYNSIKDFLSSCVADFMNFGKAIKDFVVNPMNGFNFQISSATESDATKAAAERMRANTFDKKPTTPFAAPTIPPEVQAAIDAAKAAAANATKKPSTVQPEDPKAAQEAKDTETTMKSFMEYAKGPQGKFEEIMERLSTAYINKDISADQFKRAGDFAAKESGLSTAPHFAGAIEASSKEGYSLVASAMAGRTSFGGKGLEKSSESTAKNTAELLTLNREQVKRNNIPTVEIQLA